MKVQFVGAAKMVTGSCYLLETQGKKVLIDCGLYQGSRQVKERNYGAFPFSPKEISCCLLTHAHTDHTGLVPKLFKEGFRGPVLATKATVELCKIMLPDSGHIQEMEVERKNRKLARAGQPLLVPIYTAEEALDCTRYFKGVDYDEIVELFPGLQVRFRDAGHILGSAMLEVWVNEDGQERKLVFSGDIGNKDQPYVKNPSCLESADYIIMESTYGNRLHEDEADRQQQFKRIIKETMAAGGNLVIPAFAIERTQDLLYYLNLLYEGKEIEPVDVYIDSPLAIAATKIFRKNAQYFDGKTQELIKNGEDPLNLPHLHFSQTAEDSQALNEIKGGAILIAASGMADAGRIKHHLKHNLWRPECTVLFVGYQAEGTLGRRLVNGETNVVIHGEEIAVQAKIEKIDGFSAHADQKGLLEWVSCSGSKAKTIILVHGEEEAQKELAQRIKEMTGLEPMIPSLGETFQWSGEEIIRIAAAEPPVVKEAEKKGQRNEKHDKLERMQVNRTLVELRAKINYLLTQDKHEQDLNDVLGELQELTGLVKKGLHKRRRR